MANDDLNQSETIDVRKVCSQRWQLKKNPRKLKQLPGIEPYQCRKARIKTNHVACVILVGSFIKISHLMEKAIYQLKSELLSEYL
jgi:chorismate-pyruvate lyase